ncbi:hypothetical protein BN946_scf184851.g80 [Trametes cinnabarina]|uniref:Mid2 domain-containing protein n=1 Tax=Pycnoporus cinnabarinus TaxID=5643 RepID=A0A060S5H2_PYCCI|nr:hypothetical protein BN946_scf184851.g80 [Trametes cinnabarina]
MYLQRQAVLLWSLLAVLRSLVGVNANVNITLEDTASQIIYSPPACGLTLSSESSAGTEAQTQICNGAWRIIAAQDASGGTLTTTSGPNNSSGGLIPQLFLSVRALALYVKTTALSTALVNVTVSTINPVVTVRSEINSSVEFISIINLPEDRVTTLSLTFVQSNETTRLDIDSITVAISDNNTTPFIAPSLPPSTVLPTSTPSIVIPSSARAAAASGQTSGAIAAEVLGALMGAAIVAAAAFLFVRFRRRRRRPVLAESEKKDDSRTLPASIP